MAGSRSVTHYGDLVTRIIAFHSFRRGTGRTSIMASLAVLLARQRKRVGIIDTNMQSPSAHILFKMGNEDINQTLDSYLRGESKLEETIYDVGKNAGLDDDCLYLIPASDNMARIMHVLKEGFEINVLTEAFFNFSKTHHLDHLFIDSSSGITEEILLSLSFTDVLVIVMRLDDQDYQGVGLTIDLAKRLDLAKSLIIVNQIPTNYELGLVEKQVSENFQCEVAAVLPYTEDFLNLASKDIFVVKYPEHQITRLLEKLASKF